MHINLLFNKPVDNVKLFSAVINLKSFYNFSWGAKTQGLENFYTHTFTKLFKTSFWSPDWHHWHVSVDGHVLMHLCDMSGSVRVIHLSRLWKTNYTMISHQAVMTSCRCYKLSVYGVLSSESDLLYSYIKKIMCLDLNEQQMACNTVSSDLRTQPLMLSDVCLFCRWGQ